MSNKDNFNQDAEIAKDRRLNLLTIVLGVIAIVLVGMFIHRFIQVNEVQSDIKNMKSEKKVNELHNKKVAKEQNDMLKKLGLGKVKSESNTFNNLFFDWSGWGEYTKNMEELQDKYPEIDKGDVVDISGRLVGNGEGPRSRYTSNVYTTSKQGEIAEFIEQNKSADDSRSKALWFKLSNYKDGNYNITDMNVYREVDMTMNE